MTDDEYKQFGKAVEKINARGWTIEQLRQFRRHGGGFYWNADVSAPLKDYPVLPYGDLFSTTGVGPTAHEALQDAIDRTMLRVTGGVIALTEALEAAALSRTQRI